MKRRTVLGIGAGAALAVPAVLQGRWLLKDFERPGFDPIPVGAGGPRWRNWSGLVRANPREIFAPASEEELAAKMANWDGQIRPVGSGHSFTALAPSRDLMVDISRLSGLLSVDKAAKTAVFGAGTRLRQAAMLAHKEGLAFPNLPDIDVQTLAGSFATATHGTGREMTALHGRVRGFRLITPSGEIRDVTRQSDPDLFDAGRVSLGALGIITRYEIQLTDSFALNRQVFLVPVEEAISTMAERARAHHYFEFYVLPHTGYAALITHDIHAGEVLGREPSKDEEFINTFKTLRDTLGWWPWARRKAFQTYVNMQLDETGMVEDVTDIAWKLLATSRLTRFNEIEYHIPEAEGEAALRRAVAVMEREAEHFFPIEVRFTGQDDAWLSPFNDGVRCSIAVHALHSEPYGIFAEEIEPIFREQGGRPHWGKLHSLGAEALAALYPRFADFAALRAGLDPQGRMLNPHLARLVGAEMPGGGA